ncbi:hypothetical protein ACVWZA_001141 [Sphingomonas sp. UYAg733]
MLDDLVKHANLTKLKVTMGGHAVASAVTEADIVASKRSHGDVLRTWRTQRLDPNDPMRWCHEDP